MEQFLRGILPRILVDPLVLDVNCFIRPHQGKQDLQKSLPNNLRAYRYYPENIRLLVIQDQDSADCQAVKAQLTDLIQQEYPVLRHKIRIACRELENWYLGDLQALETAYPQTKATKQERKAKFRNPGHLNGSQEMQKWLGQKAKMEWARRLGSRTDPNQNKSPSFQNFIRGLQALTLN